MKIKHTDVFSLELSSQVALDEGGLSSTTITDKHKLEAGALLKVQSRHGGNRQLHDAGKWR